jgi:hypothetical protein
MNGLAHDNIQSEAHISGFGTPGPVTRMSGSIEAHRLCVKRTFFISQDTWQHYPSVTEGFIYLYRFYETKIISLQVNIYTTTGTKLVIL